MFGAFFTKLWFSCNLFIILVIMVPAMHMHKIPKNLLPDIPKTYRINGDFISAMNLAPSSRMEDKGIRFTGAKGDPVETANRFVRNLFGGEKSDNKWLNFYTTSWHTSDTGISHVYLGQLWNGLEITNGEMNLNILNETIIISYGCSFYEPSLEAATSDADENPPVSLVSPLEALLSAADYFDLPGRSMLMETVQVTLDIADQWINSENRQSYILGNVGFVSDGRVPCHLAYIQTSDGKLELVWDMVIDVKTGENWFHTQVSAKSGKVLAYVDWVSNSFYDDFDDVDDLLHHDKYDFDDLNDVDDSLSVYFDLNSGNSNLPSFIDLSSSISNFSMSSVVPQYAAYGFGTTSPLAGSRSLFRNISDFIASPRGWQRIRNLIYLGTQGNNVRAQENYDGSLEWEKKYRPNGGLNHSFVFPLDLKKAPRDNQDAAITNLFFWNNMIHDIFYYYGFTEKSGNFQDENFGRGGKENDGVIANAMDGSGVNNANFATPPDGLRPRMRMYVWNFNTPNRDGDLESTIIIHEYGHGVSMRLTGGSASGGCLGSPESAGMGEGWSDFFGLLFHMKSNFNEKTILLMGEYVFNGRTIRKFPYSSDLNINPQTYAYIRRTGYTGPHAKGSIWAQILLDAYWSFVKKYGFSTDWKRGTKGNNRILHDVVDSLKLQPCNPSFIDARNAILQANKIRYGGQDICLWWRAFAPRGLGVDAGAGGFEDFTLPSECGLYHDDQEPISFF